MTMKLGILGLGEGRSLISAVQSSERWEIGGVCDLNESLCRTRCHEFSIDGYTLEYENMLADPEIDAVGIYTPDRFHAQHIRMALDAGKHVICTKPLLTDLSDACALITAQQKAGRHVFVGQSSRFFEPMVRQREDVEAGLLGEIITVEAHYVADHRWFLKKPMTKPETFKWLYGCISHPADLVVWYLPEIEEVMGYGMLSDNGRECGLTEPDTMHFILKCTDGRIARVSGAYSAPVQPRQMNGEMSCVIRGSKGCSQADYPDLRYGRTVENAGRDTEHIETYMHREEYYHRFAGHTHHAGEYQNYIDYVAACIETGETPLPDLREGICTVALMSAMDKSLRTGQPVRIADILREAGVS